MEEIARQKGVEPDAIEVWFADEARVGQKNKITRRWAKRGARPSAPKDQRIASAYIFGAICPKGGKGAALVMPRCDTQAMNLHLAEIATQIALGAHAALLVDQAGWRLSRSLIVPSNITLIALPAKCPELEPAVKISGSIMRDNWLSNRIFKSYDDIVDHCRDACNKLVDQPWKIMSIGLRDWGVSVMIRESWYYIRIRPAMGELQRVARLLADIPEIVECDRVTGEDCFIAKVFAPRIDNLERVFDKLLPYA